MSVSNQAPGAHSATSPRTDDDSREDASAPPPDAAVSQVDADGGQDSTAAEQVAETPLHRNRNFTVLWSGAVFSGLAVEVVDIAFPLLLLGATQSPALAALFGTVQGICTLAAGLPVGQLVDRFDRRIVLAVSEALRALSVLAITLHTLNFDPSIPLIIGVAAVLGITQPCTGAARMLLIRSVVPSSQLTQALTREEARTFGAQLAGPALGGALYGLSIYFPFAFSAVSLALASLSGLAISKKAPTVPAQSPPGGAFSGLVNMWKDPAIRWVALLIALLNATVAPIALLVLVILKRQDTPSWQIGAATAALAVGGLAGTALVSFLHSRLQPGQMLLTLAMVEVPLLCALALPWGPIWIAVVLFMAALGVPALRVLVDVLIFRQVPDAERGRTIAAVMTLFSVGVPIGTALSGVLLQWLPEWQAVLVLASLLTLGAMCAASQRSVRQARWPEAAHD